MGYDKQPRPGVEEVTMNAFEKSIATELNNNRAIPSDILAVRDTTPGVTDALYVNNVIDALGGTYPAFSSALERNKTAKVPTLQKVLDLLGYTDDEGAKDGKGKFGWEKFVENFAKDMDDRPGREGNRSRILGTPEFGERGWETVKRLWRQASNDKMLRDIARERVAALDGSAGARLPLVGAELPVPVSKVLGTVSGVAQDLFAPRTRKAWEEGRDPELGEYGMDAFQNLAYAAPIGGIGSGIARALGGSQVAKTAGTVLANAIAPTAISAGDYVLDTKDYAGVPDAALDAFFGTATNLGVNKVLYPMITNFLGAGLARNPRMQAVVEFLEGTPSDKERARDLIRTAEDKVKRHFGESNSEYMQKLRSGKTPDRLSDGELKGYLDILNARDKLEDKTVVGKFSDFMKGIRESEKAVGKYNPAGNIGKVPLSEVDDLYAAQAGKTSVDDIVDRALGKVGYRTPEEMAAWDIKEFVADKGGNRLASASRALKANPELVSQFDRPSMREILNRPSTWLDVGKSWAVNRAGDDAAAQRMLSRFGVDVQDIRKEQDQARKEKAAARDVSRILEARKPELDERDMKFLADIADNPEIATVGHPTDPEGFKLWLLEKGHSLLSGTSASRPTWDVK